jgi:hypothetical protein
VIGATASIDPRRSNALAEAGIDLGQVTDGLPVDGRHPVLGSALLAAIEDRRTAVTMSIDPVK